MALAESEVQNELSGADIDFSQVAMADHSQLYELIKLVKEHIAWRGAETLSELSDPTRKLHEKIMMLRRLSEDHKRLYREIFDEDYDEVYRKVYGDKPKDPLMEFSDFVTKLKEEDLLLRVSYKRRGRKEFVEVLGNRLTLEKKKRFWQR